MAMPVQDSAAACRNILPYVTGMPRANEVGRPAGSARTTPHAGWFSIVPAPPSLQWIRDQFLA
jgi:hypothetical protein